MPHVTFIHGISNKPPVDDLLRIWREALAGAAEALPLGDLGVTSTMVYWADLLYEKAEEDLSAYEGVLENTAEAIDGAGDAPPPVPRTSEEAAFLDGLRAKLTALSEAELATAEPPPVPAQPRGALERVPLPWFIKKRFLNAYLRDVHHYLFDVEFAPPGGTPVRIQQTIRKRFIDAVGGTGVSRPHVVVSHSMGTVIAYDCLKRVAECVPVDGLITIGSPLGIDEVQDKLQPGWSRERRLPAREDRAPLGQPVRPPRSRMRLRSDARQRLPQGRCGDGRGRRGEERRHMAAFRHEISAPAQLLRGPAPHAR